MSEGRNVIPEQLNYRAQSFASPYYKFSRIVPLSGSQTVSIPLNSTVETLMEIPTNVFNNAESVLSADVQYVSQQTSGNVDMWTWIYLDGMPLISEVDLYTRSGVYLCQLPNFQNYMKLVRKVFTDREEYENNDQSTFLFPSNSLVSAPPCITPSNGNGSVNYLENAYVASNANYGQAISTNIDFTLNMKLGAIKKTIFEMNKDIVFPDIIVLRILWGPATKAMYGGTSGVNPATGATTAISAKNSASPAPVLTGVAIVVYNLQLLLAVEKNEDLAQSVRALVNSPQGLNLLINYPYSYKQNLGGLSQNISLRFNRGHGKSLVAILNSPFSSTESANTAYDNSNVTNASTASQSAVGSKVLNYYTQLDNVRLQDLTLTCGNQFADDWRENRRHLKDTPYLNAQVYQNNWFHMDKFSVPDKDICDENLDQGMSLIVERKWDSLANMAGNGNTTYNWYTFAICQKDLHIGSNMIQYQ